MYRIIVSSLIAMTLWTNGISALWCYESDPDTGLLRSRNCPTCSFCVIASTGLGQSSSTVFALGNDAEDLSVYAPIFEQGRDTNWAYKVMSTCVLERYVIGFKEYFFRCFCNSDFCNKAEDIATFLSNTVSKDASVDDQSHANAMNRVVLNKKK